MDYSFKEFLEDSKIGREIHFIFGSENYYIGCNTGQFMFWKFDDSNSEVIGEDAEELLQKVKFDGKPLKEVWHLIKIDTIF
ncbi:hypothetical protein [Neobacillus sp. YIM B06451]|uniref:hypothetical protein n=1 Tax=Neobacillus sp. YIM B06451 TaxID=3070994 RepID=UPI00292E34B2|nr:hypothetical protein [Neobacillus sp. YIM B06451]